MTRALAKNEDKRATKNDLIELESNLQRDMRELEYRIIIKLGGLMAVSIAAALPVSVPTEATFKATVVLPSRVLRSAALTEESLTVME